MSTSVNHQSAPYPNELAEMVKGCSYRKAWRVWLADDYDRGQGSVGLTLIIRAQTVNSHDQDQSKGILHYFPVPPAAYDRRSWQRWLFECFHQVEFHECMEFFEIDGVKVYSPSHGEGNDPYMLREVGTQEDVTTLAGTRSHGSL